jgi:hypothetical protein
MESELKLIKARDEVFRKIGRNLLNFQKIEQMLKYLIANGRMSGNMSEIIENQEQRSASINKHTMGQLVGQFMDNTYQGLEESNHTLVENEPHISFSFMIRTSSDFYESKSQALKTLVDGRNELIHHLLSHYTLNSIESYLELEQHLDEQRERIVSEYEYLKSVIEKFEEVRILTADCLNSDEFKEKFSLLLLQNSQLTACLHNFAQENARSDGWALLSSAANFIRQHLPQELTDLEKNHGHKKLKSFMLATEFFDFCEEPTVKDGIRILYRIKPGLINTD